MVRGKGRTALTWLCDVILVNLGIILSFLIRFSGKVPSTNFRAYLNIALWVSLISGSVLYFSGLYEEVEEESSFDIFYKIFISVSLSSIIIVALSFYLRNLPFPRTVFVIAWILEILLISAHHSYLFYSRQRKIPPKRLLVIGTDEEEFIRESKRQSSPKYEIVGLVNADAEVENLKRTIRKGKVQGVIISDLSLERSKLLDIIFGCQQEGLSVYLRPGLYEVMMGRLEMTHIGDIPLIKLKDEPLKGRDKALKGIMDFSLSLLILLFSSPLLFLIPLLIKMESKGPFLYRQKRVGEKERIYEIYKFRSMIENAEERTGPILAKDTDERVTKVGNLLRRTHLDELPQLFNILRGEMSLIGPRPERPVFVEEFKRKIPGYSRRFMVKPGITGLAQLYGNYDTSAEKKIKYDIAYINNWSLGLDLKILFMSMEIVLRMRK
ncbi:hypothetical protein DRJ00_02795 [Candidatus Aerophobetes bacterium]|uniref:Bacterial sugar transferase domain-containing protein n=1 Tax=Aerophobetes bacterium TaxID=2030807 RepID=A0A497E7G5_UNCAE|nr:MAG: hypothetical protein DRJ00_02795 [Candidatus Aerophobetes bacterium]